MPMSVGVKLGGDSPVDLLIPVVFYNSGAQPTNQVVRDITATLTPIEGDATNQSLYFKWFDTQMFMGKVEFEDRYPDKKEDVYDYIVYESRSVPFNIKGGESNSKLLHLRLISEDPKINNLSAFQLLLNVETSGRGKDPEKFSYYYRKSGINEKGYNWFDRQNN